MRRLAVLSLLALAVALGCGDSGFDPPSLVNGPRVLAVIVTPPEAAPGQDVAFTTLAATPNGDELTLEWRIELSTAALAAGAGQTSVGSSAEPLVLAGDAVLSGEATARAIADLTALIEGAPAGTPEHVVGLVYERVGLPVLATFTAREASGAIVVEGFKRFFLTPRAQRTTNPPPPRFSIAGRYVSARGADPLACAPEGELPEVVAGTTTTLVPEEGDEAWLETYPALDLEGEVIENREAAFYSWHSTAGEFGFAVTRAPDRSVEWTAPDEPGEHPIWLVVRDGHLGTSACRASVRVVAR